MVLSVVLALLLAWPVAAGDKLPLWRAEAEGGPVIHLLGSVHALNPGDYPLPAPINEAYAAADTVVFEVDMTRVSQQEIAAVTRELGLFSPPASLETALSDETRQVLEAFLSTRGATLAQVAAMKPWLLGLQISLQEITRLGYDPNFGVDMHFLQRAVGDGKTIGQLETFRSQMESIAADPMPVQDLALRAALEESANIEEELLQLMSMWRAGDADALYELGMKAVENYPSLAPQLDRLIHQRNRKMAEEIRRIASASEGEIMVIVGAMHLGGEQGLLRLLAEDFSFQQVGNIEQKQKDKVDS